MTLIDPDLARLFAEECIADTRRASDMRRLVRSIRRASRLARATPGSEAERHA